MQNQLGAFLSMGCLNKLLIALVIPMIMGSGTVVAAGTANIFGLDFSSDSFCPLSPKAQYRDGLYFLPNQSKPYTGNSKCIFSINGQVMSEGHIELGLPHGEWIQWYVNGQMEARTLYLKGEQHGASTTWYENGQKKSSGVWVLGIKKGEWQFWHENGQLSEANIYKSSSIEDENLDSDITEQQLAKNVLLEGWVVQLAIFGNKQNAERLKQKLLKQGWKAHLKDDDAFYRIYVGPTKSRATANKLQKKLRHQFDMAGLVTYVE